VSAFDRRTFGKLFFGAGLGAAMIGATGCTPQSGSTTGGQASAAGQTLTLALDTEYASFDPAKQQSGGAPVTLWQGIFDTLLRYEPDGTIVPNAAESFDFNAEKTKMTLKLRSGMKFTDGSPVDGAAVKASMEHMKTGGGSDASRIADVTVTVPDPSTVVLTTEKPKGLLPTFLCLSTGIVASPASLKATDRDTKPVGSGPYALDPANTTSGSKITLNRNPDYWNKAAFPYDKVVFQIQPDITARVNALKSGQINGAYITTQTKNEIASSGFNVIGSAVNWAGLFLGDRNGKRIKALGDLKVRQAINMVFDRQAIVKALFLGEGKVSNQIFNDKSEAFLPELVDRYPFDVEKAKSLMASSSAPDGFSFDLPIINGLDYANPIITQQLGLIGIKATPVKIPGGQVIPQLLSGKFPIFYFTLESRTALWDIVQSLQPNSVWNVNKDTDPELTPLLDAAQTATGAEAKTNAQKINTFLVEQAWFCPWALPTNFYATDKKTTATAVLGASNPYLATFKPV
jgi:peptide/nickel transport system substrate-binding protein